MENIRHSDYRYENWKDIKGFEGYMISDYGRVKSKRRYVEHTDGRRRLLRERILKPSYLKTGYPVVNLMRDGKNNTSYIARLVAEHFLNLNDRYEEVYFKDGDRSNVHISNLGIRCKAERNLTTRVLESSDRNTFVMFLLINKYDGSKRVIYTTKELSNVVGITIKESFEIYAKAREYETEEFIIKRIDNWKFEIDPEELQKFVEDNEVEYE